MTNQDTPPRNTGGQSIYTGQVPYSQEAEEAVIGAVLVNPEAFLAVASFLQADDFFLVRHRYIWDALQRISDRNENIDYLTVHEELRTMNRLQDVGGAAYITQLINNTPTSMHAEIYGRLVERAAIRRRLLQAADDIKALALDEELAIEKVTDESESRLFRVTERNLRRDLLPMRVAISEYFDTIEHLIAHQDEPLGLPTGFRDLDEMLGGLQRSDLLIFAGRPGMGKCLVAGSLIATERGLVPIESLMPRGVAGMRDDEGGVFYPLKVRVQTPNGAAQTSHFYDSGMKPTLTLTTQSGYTLTGTHVHPVKVLTAAGDEVWKPLADLAAGDVIALQQGGALWGDVVKLPRMVCDVAFPREMSPQLAYLLGIMTSAGDVSQSDMVRLQTPNPDALQAFMAWLDELGLVYDASADALTVDDPALWAWLRLIGVTDGGVPSAVMQAPQVCVEAFLAGVFDASGLAENDQRDALVTGSSALAKQIQVLLLQCGMTSARVFERGRWVVKLTQTIGVALVGGHVTQAQPVEYGEAVSCWDAVVSIEDGGLQHCYDLTVPDGHAFIADGVVNHNTAFLLSVALNAAKVGGRVAIFTMEMGYEQIVQRIVSMETGINTQKLRLGQLTPQEWSRFVQASGRLGNLPIFIDDTPAMSPLQMRTKCRRLAHDHGINLVIIDYMQLMSAGGQYENNRVQEISYISRSIKELARELNVPVFSAAQLSRAVEQRQDKRPQLSDLRESGSIEQDADCVIFLYRDIVYNEATEFPNRADLIVAKHRNGPTGVVSLHFEKSLTKFSDARTQTIDLSGL